MCMYLEFGQQFYNVFYIELVNLTYSVSKQIILFKRNYFFFAKKKNKKQVLLNTFKLQIPYYNGICIFNIFNKLYYQ